MTSEQEAGPGRAGGRTSVVQRVAHTPGRRTLTVQRVVDLSPTMRRVVLAGLEPEFPFLPLAATDHVKLVLPDEDTGALVMPERGSTGFARPDGRPVVTRDYTVRAHDAAAGELTLDFVLHEHGPAGRWGIAAQPGAVLGALGPRGSQVHPEAIGHYLLVADETGLPALERFVEELPPATRVDAVVLAPGGTPRDLPRRDGLSLCTLPCEDLEQAAREVVQVVDTVDLSEDSFVFGAGEASVMRELRTRLRRHPRLDNDRVSVRGYWRTGLSGALPPD